MVLKSISSIIAFLIAILLIVPGPAMAQDNLLRVAFNEHPPWKVINNEGQPDGIDIELLRILAEEMKLRIKFIHVPFKRGLKMLEIGEVDIMTGVLRRSERDAYLHFIEPAYKNQSHKAFFVLKGREFLVQKYTDLHHLRVGTSIGGKFFPQFDEDKAIRKYPVKNAELNIKMLQAKRIETFIMTESTGEYWIAKLRQGQSIGKAPYAHREKQNVYMVLSKKSIHSQRLDEFNLTMNKLVQAETMKRIKARFFQALAGQ